MKKRILSVALALCMLLALLSVVSVPTGAFSSTPTYTSVGNISGDVGEEVTLTATLTDSGGSPVSGQSVTFSINSLDIGSAETDTDGVASLSYTIALSEGSHQIGASFASTELFDSSNGSGTLTVAADTTPPASPVYSPLDNATGVAVGVTPTLIFSEALYGDASGTPMSTTPTGVIWVCEGTDNAGPPLTEGAGADNAHFTVTYDSANHVFTVTFGAEIKNGQSYYLELQANKIYDAAGNTISDAQGVTFTTEVESLFAGGAGTSGDPYKIATETQLGNLAELVNGEEADDENNGGALYSTLYYELTSDITLHGVWTPIGTYEKKFNGHFNGNGHTISGLSIASGGYVGLFGYADNGSEIKNIGLKDISITATGSFAGGVAGYTAGTVSACWVSGSVASTSTMVGGVAGILHTGGSITDCYTAVSVSGTGYIGGVVGSARGPVSFCYTTGSVSCSGSHAGGIVGWRYNITQISNCAALNLSVSGGSDVGRIVGGTSETMDLEGNVALADMMGVGFGTDRGISTKNGADKTAAQIASAGFWCKDIDHLQDDWSSTVWDKAAGRLPKLKDFSSSQPEQPFPFGGADGSDADNAYLISSEYELRLLAILVNAGNPDYRDKYYRLTADIDLNGEWTPIGTDTNRFKGHFDGGDYTISGLSITSPGDYAGLFGVSATGSEIKNLNLEDVGIVTVGSYVGGVSGTSYGTISDCSIAGSVTGENGVGGVAGFACGILENSYAICDVSGTQNVGGVVGIAGDTMYSISVSISDCFASGDVTGGTGEMDQDAGGVIGFLAFNSTAINCYATGSVSGNFCIGGVVGGTYGAVSNCYAAGEVSGASSVGGVAGVAANNPLLNCVALNPSVSGSINVGRVVGDLGINVTDSDTAAFAGMMGWDFGTESGAATKNGADLNSHDITGTMNERFGGNSSITSNPWTSCGFSDLPAFTGISSVPRPDHLYAVVTFNANGGSVSPSSVRADADGKLSNLPEPSQDSYSFDGWYLTADGSGDAVTVDTVFENSATVYGKWTATTSHTGGGSASRTITVTETSSWLFSDAQGVVRAEANMTSAFSRSVEVKVTDTDESAAGFGLGNGNTVYPFDISLYFKGTDTKTEPKDGYAVKISLPVPDDLLDMKERLLIVHKADDGSVKKLASQLKQISGIWYLVFEATDFSPYALVVNSAGAYDKTSGLPYYVDSEGNKVFIGFEVNGKYIAPPGVTVLFQENAKMFTDIGSHWAKDYIGFVTEREIFLGTGSNTFSPDFGMTRAMFATVIGRLYEHSFGEIEVSGDHAFTDCDYDDYYGKYVDWAAESGILGGYGNNLFGPSDSITREQMAALLYRFAEFLGILPGNMDTMLKYPDADSISSYAEKAALYCQSSGIITGRGGGSFVPQGTATRAEVAVILERFIKNILG